MELKWLAVLVVSMVVFVVTLKKYLAKPQPAGFDAYGPDAWPDDDEGDSDGPLGSFGPPVARLDEEASTLPPPAPDSGSQVLMTTLLVVAAGEASSHHHHSQDDGAAVSPDADLSSVGPVDSDFVPSDSTVSAGETSASITDSSGGMADYGGGAAAPDMNTSGN